MTVHQAIREALSWAKYVLGFAGVLLLALVALKVFGIQFSAIRTTGIITELAVVAAACIYASR